MTRVLLSYSRQLLEFRKFAEVNCKDFSNFKMSKLSILDTRSEKIVKIEKIGEIKC